MPGIPDVDPIKVIFERLFQALNISLAGSYQNAIPPEKTLKVVKIKGIIIAKNKNRGKINFFIFFGEI
jgi:hypothetical protein